MFAPSLLLSALALVAGMFPPPQVSKWKAGFDYSTLPPSDEQLWAPLVAAQVPLEQAIEIAAESEGAPIRVMMATPKELGDGPVWYLQLFVEGEGGKQKRVNVQVSTMEPKVVKRLELRAIARDEEVMWAKLGQSKVPASIALGIAKERLVGDRPKSSVKDPRVRQVTFDLGHTPPVWKVELMGIDQLEEVRRYEMLIQTERPAAKQKLMLDRFAGEPLRSGDPTALENGMFLYDFVVGDGLTVAEDSKVEVNYRLFLVDGTKLHDTWETKRTETFPASEAPLKGITKGLIDMRVGGRRKIVMPYELGFGEMGNELAPPKAIVICDIQVENMAR